MNINSLSKPILLLLILLNCSYFGQASEIPTVAPSLDSNHAPFNTSNSQSIYELLESIQSQNEITKSDNNIDLLNESYGTNNNTFDKIFPMLKNSFKISQFQNPKLQNIIDKTIQVIYDLPNSSNQFGFCSTIPALLNFEFNFDLSQNLSLHKNETNNQNASEDLNPSIEFYRKQLGVSTPEIARKIYLQCLERGSIKTPFGTQLLKKNYVFVKVSDPDFFLSGWTNNVISSGRGVNLTHLFIKPKTTWGDLVLAIIHEMYITNDSKLFINYGDIAHKYKKTDKSSCPQFSTGSCVVTYNIKNESNKMLRMASLPEIAYTFSIMRAKEIERKVLSELTRTSITRPDLREEFEKIYSKIPQYIDTTGKDSLLDIDIDYSATAKEQFPDLEAAKKYILDANNKFILPDNSEVDFVEFMSTPEFALRSHEVLSTGPGCGYCGGAFAPEIKNDWDQYWQSIFNGTSK